VAYYDSVTPKPLFKTPGQPITTKPTVMFHCEKGGYLVAFGTGKYLGMDDLADTSQQAVYGIWDYGEDADDSEYVGTFNGSLITDTYLPSTVSLLQQIVVDERTEQGLVLRTAAAAIMPARTTVTPIRWALSRIRSGMSAGTLTCRKAVNGWSRMCTFGAGRST
jgi:Tfp pilus tip-associated adhesin PilY1